MTEQNTTTKTAKPNRPKRRWRQFTLRAMLLLFVMAALVMYWVHSQIVPARNQRLAVAAILENGGMISYKSHAVFNQATMAPEDIPAPSWWKDLLGEDPDLRVASVSVGQTYSDLSTMEMRRVRGVLKSIYEFRLSGSRYAPQYGSDQGDENLQFVRALRGLEELEALGPSVTNEGIKYLSDITTLRTLDLGWSKVSDDGLVALQNLSQLHSLQLDYTPVTDASLAEIAKLDSLRELNLCHTSISGSGIEQLADIPRLNKLGLTGTSVDDDACQELAKLPSLKVLTLGCTWVADDGAAALSRIETLEELDLSATRVSDVGLRYIAELPNLRKLFLGAGDQKKYTKEGLAAFKQQRPNVEVRANTLSVNPDWLRQEWAEKRAQR